MKKVKLAYNGWTNYETWLVSVHDLITAMQEIALEGSDIAEQISESEDWKDAYEDNEVDAEWCEDMFTDFVGRDIPNRGIIGDMVGASISEINFHEIADHVNDYLKEEAERLDDELRGSGRR